MEISEVNDEPKMANVYLYTRPTEQLQTSFDSLNALLNSDTDLAECVQSWVMVVDFIEQDRALYIEAKQKDCILVPKVSYSEPPHIIRRKHLGITKVSPAYIIQKALSNQFSLEEWDFAFENCQNWFVEMYQYLGLEEKNCPVPIKYHIKAAKAIAAAALKGLVASQHVKRTGLLGQVFTSAAVSSKTLLEDKKNVIDNPCFKSSPSKKN